MLAVLTCIDARLDPLAILGLELGEAVIVRTPGARVTDETLGSLVVARYLLGAERVVVVAHTDCRVSGRSSDELRAAVAAAGKHDTDGLVFASAPDQAAALRDDVARLRAELGVPVDGHVYDVQTGELSPAAG